MAQYVLPFVATIPAGTPKTAPVTVPMTFDGWTIERLDLEVPPGPAGKVGFQLFNNGVPWIPFGAGQWIVWDDTRESYPMTDQPNASGWAIVGYNTGKYDHAVTVRLHVNPIQTSRAAQPPVTVTFVTSGPPPVAEVPLT